MTTTTPPIEVIMHVVAREYQHEKALVIGFQIVQRDPSFGDGVHYLHDSDQPKKWRALDKIEIKAWVSDMSESVHGWDECYLEDYMPKVRNIKRALPTMVALDDKINGWMHGTGEVRTFPQLVCYLAGHFGLREITISSTGKGKRTVRLFEIHEAVSDLEKFMVAKHGGKERSRTVEAIADRNGGL